MTTQQPTRRPTQVARVVTPQERPVTAAEIRNALQSVVRRLERLEEKVDRLTGLAEMGLAETGSVGPSGASPAASAAAVTAAPELAHGDADLPSGPSEDTMETEADADDAPHPDDAIDEADAVGLPDTDADADMDEPPDLVAAGEHVAAGGYMPPPPPPSAGPQPYGSSAGREAEERHSRIAERFAERAPEPPAEPDDDEYDGATRHTSVIGPETDDDATYEALPQRRRHGSGVGRIALWGAVAVAVVVGGAYVVLDGLGGSDEDPQQVADAGNQELLDQAPNETIPVAGQSPLSGDEPAADDGAPAETAGAAPGDTAPGDTAPSSDDAAAPAEATVEMAPIPAETADAAPPADAEGGVEAGTDAGTRVAADMSGSAAGPAATAAEDPDAEAAGDQPAGDAPAETDIAAADQPADSVPDAAPVELVSDGPGPQVASAPVTQVETVDMQDQAPLPADAPDNLRDIAALALQGNPEAQHDLATAYAIGTSIPQNFERAAFWYARSAEAGVVNARYNLGVLTERGLGVQQDSEAAFAMFLEAAERNHPDAQNAVGLAYMHGHGTEKDLLQAATWFQAASGQGNPRGAYHLGRLFEEGLEGAPDLTAAAGWYRVAAESGDAQAEEALARISPALDGPPTDNPPAIDVPVPDSTPEPVTPGTAQDLAVTQQEIEQIQQLLADAGYEPGPADGLMGPSTRSAIEAFQRDTNLSITGEPSFSLLDALRVAATAEPETQPATQ